MKTIIERRTNGRLCRLARDSAGIIVFLAVVGICAMLIFGVVIALTSLPMTITVTDYLGRMAMLAWLAYTAYQVGKYFAARVEQAWVPVRQVDYRVRRVKE